MIIFCDWASLMLIINFMWVFLRLFFALWCECSFSLYLDEKLAWDFGKNWNSSDHCDSREMLLAFLDTNERTTAGVEGPIVSLCWIWLCNTTTIYSLWKKAVYVMHKICFTSDLMHINLQPYIHMASSQNLKYISKESDGWSFCVCSLLLLSFQLHFMHNKICWVPTHLPDCSTIYLREAKNNGWHISFSTARVQFNCLHE